MPLSCDAVTPNAPITLSEIFRGDETYPPYIELAVHEDMWINYLSISGDALRDLVEFS